MEKRRPRGLDVADQCGLLQFFMMNLLGPVTPNDVCDPVVLCVIHHEARVYGRRVGHDAQSEARGPSAIRHGLANVDDLDTADRPVAGEVPLDPLPDRRGFARFAGNDQDRLTTRRRHQLRVEQVGFDSVRERHLGVGHLDIFEPRHHPLASRQQPHLVGEGLFVSEQHTLIGDRDDIVVERTGGDRFLRLLGKNGALRVQPMPARDCSRRLDMLPRGKCTPRHAVDEELNARLKRRALVVLFTEFVDSVMAELLIESLKRMANRHVVIFVTMQDPTMTGLTQAEPDNFDTIARAVVAHDFLRERSIVLERIARLGVHCLDAPVGGLTVGLLNRYLEIKQTGLL